jgi:hypothetical protein
VERIKLSSEGVDRFLHLLFKLGRSPRRQDEMQGFGENLWKTFVVIGSGYQLLWLG